MSAAGLPLIEMLKTRMQWHQARQKVLAENVANADTPGFAPRDVKPVAFGPGGGAQQGALGMARTAPLHLAGFGGRSGPGSTDASRFETTPSGNAVSLEDEMLKVAQNQSDYQLAASLYEKGLHVLRVAVGKR